MPLGIRRLEQEETYNDGVGGTEKKGQHIDGAHVDLLPGDCLFSTGARNHVE